MNALLLYKSNKTSMYTSIETLNKPKGKDCSLWDRVVLYVRMISRQSHAFECILRKTVYTCNMTVKIAHGFAL